MKNRTILSGGLVAVVAAAFMITPDASAQWVNFTNQTATRMPVGPGLNTAALSTTDVEEKDYAWGDVDNDGDIDLICVRKQPFTSAGRKTNVLFMNEGIAEGHSINGVLVDRTAQYATAVDMDGDGITDPQPASDQGFLTPTNDRDVVLADVNNDGWLDIITATTLSDNAGKIIGHPRIYMNLGEIAGVWQGFRFEPHRIPNMTPPSSPNAQPRFCSVAAGDVTGDGYVDLYFGDYDSGGTQLFDFNNRLLINRGGAEAGVFDDSLGTRISTSRLVSAFGAASVIADMNNDGAIDVVKQTSLASPTHVAIHHNNPDNVGFFPDATYKQWTGAIYFVSVSDLNNDGRLDLIFTDDGQDNYLLNTGNAADGTANFQSFSLGVPSGGFGSQSVAADLNNDGWKDILISDVDVDIGGCSRRLHIYRNLGDAPNVTITEQAVGGLNNSSTHMSGTHNVAVFDIDGDGWLDLVIGRCTGTFVWMNVPPEGIQFTYPQGLPGYLEPDAPTVFTVQMTGVSGAGVARNSGKLFVSIDGDPYTETSMVPLGGDLYQATLPAVPCTSRVRYYMSGQLSGGATKFDPPTAPTESYLAIAATGTNLDMDETFEGDVSGWAVSNGPGLTAGQWEQADPNATFFNAMLAAPEDDANQGIELVKAFVTENGPVGGSAGANDIDGGATMLMSPVIDLDGTDATIEYSRWFFTSLPGPSLTTQVSNDNGSTWVDVDIVTSTIADQSLVPPQTIWQSASFIVGQYVAPTANVRVRFVADGTTPNAIVEAGIDAFRVQSLLCNEPCTGDVNGDQTVNVTDLLAVIGAWGATGENAADVNGDLIVNVTDLLAVIGAWGACP